MGWIGWGWLTDKIEKYKLLRDSCKNELEKEAYNKIIKDLEEKEKENLEK